MLARAIEAREDDSEQDTGNGMLCSRQDKVRESSGPECACSQNLCSQSSVSPVPSAKPCENPVKMLQKSHSWPSETTHCEENDSCGKADETMVISI